MAKELVVAAATASAEEAVMVMLDSEFCMMLLSCGAPPPPGPLLGAAALAVAEVDMGMSPPPSEEAGGGCCAMASVAAPGRPNSIRFDMIRYCPQIKLIRFKDQFLTLKLQLVTAGYWVHFPQPQLDFQGSLDIQNLFIHFHAQGFSLQNSLNILPAACCGVDM